MRLSLALFVIVLAQIGSAAPSIKRAAAIPPPSQDPFWVAPASLASNQPGDVLRSRQVSTAYDVFAKSTYQVLYRTTSAINSPDVSVATFFAPRIASKPPRIMLLQPPTDSACVDCATSYAVLSGTPPSGLTTMTALTNGFDITIALTKGWYVVLAEAQGSKAGYISGITEAFAGLDATRALLRFPTTLSNTTGYKAVIHGYSGGGHASAWATQFASTYSPELNFVAAAYGGVPVDLRTTLDGLTGGPFASFAIGALAGTANIYPELQAWFDQNLTPSGVDAIDLVRTSCDIIAPLAFKDVYSLFQQGRASLNEAVPAKYISLGLLGQPIGTDNAAVATDGVVRIPVFQYHSRSDEIVSYNSVPDYVADQCSKGARIVLSTTALSEHITAYILYLGDAYIFLQNAFDGIGNVTQCSVVNSFVAPLFSPAYIAAVGQQAWTQILAANGKTVDGMQISF